MPDTDINFCFDPLCPFAWMTSKWVRLFTAQRGYRVDWRFISLRLINASASFGSHFPSGYDAGHAAGLRLLRVAARARPSTAAPRSARSTPRSGPGPSTPRRTRAATTRPTPAPASSYSPRWPRPASAELAGALDDESLDAGLRSETDEALSLTGKDVGTPIIHFQPSDGAAFFGPVMSRLPSETDAARLWDHVIGLAGFPGFAELKRSLRERPQLASFGVAPQRAPASRRTGTAAAAARRSSHLQHVKAREATTRPARTAAAAAASVLRSRTVRLDGAVGGRPYR